MPRKRIAVLLSGRGSNMLALARAAQDPAYPGEIVLVLSNRSAAPGLEAARQLGLHRHAPPVVAGKAATLDGILVGHQQWQGRLESLVRELSGALRG